MLLRNVAAVDLPNEDRAALTDALVGAYLETLGQDLVVARAYQVEIDALGAPARARRREALTLFATSVRDLGRRPLADGRTPPDLPWTAYIGAVYAARQLAADALDTAAEPDFKALRAELASWMSDLFRLPGPPGAGRTR